MNGAPATVCILTAGKGSRMGAYSQNINKALLPLQKKAIISHIIARFPPGTEFVIGLGYQAAQVRNYLGIAHPDVTFHFVDVEPYEGPGSGPGYSLFCCAPYLQKPFYFVSCDTLWWNQLDLQPDGNWLGVCAVSFEDSRNYCNYQIKDGLITGVKDKAPAAAPEYKAFVGLSFIQDHGLFFKGLSEKTAIAGEHQTSNGFKVLVEAGTARAVDIDWLDVGNEAQFKAAVAKFEDFDFSKSNEFLYIVNGKVIKFFSDASIAAKRVQKAQLKPGVFPAIAGHKDQFYAYAFVPGTTLYEHNDPQVFGEWLKWLQQRLWTPVDVPGPEIGSVCRSFYYDKTMERLEAYRRKYALADGTSRVNAVDLPSTADLLAGIDWESLCQGRAVFMHGDLHFDNTLYNAQRKEFLLLDWRHDFAGRVHWGDLYYDLAKLMGGLTLSYDLIKQNLLWYREDQEGITIDFGQRFLCAQYRQILGDFIVANGWDLGKVRLLVSLIYLNMSPLHHFPFDRMLYSLGRYMLWHELKQQPCVLNNGR